MAETLISLSEFWTLRKQMPMLDARSENEFAQSHIPESQNLPILNNQERIEVGTLYKQKGPEKAILKGFELVGPRFHQIQKDALAKFPEKKIIIYCWRGGMRSQILSWLLEMVGFEVFRLKGGYKTYRNFTFAEVRKDLRLLVLGGKTGVGKTQLLKTLSEQGEQVLDLEGFAHHRGSSFGAIGLPPQPTVEQFENLLAEKIKTLDPGKPIWVENESRKIGRVILPDRFFEQMLKSPLIDLQKTEEERIHHIQEEYAQLPKTELIQAVKRLQKRLGGLRTQEAIAAIQEDNHPSWIQNLLIYYDKTYDFDLHRHETEKTLSLDLSHLSLPDQVNRLLNAKQQLYGN
ncbi:tRNA 2-selenouridine(34) synthase MnmH [Algoriphagus mannitolivorans]|uniref:tRNA 2-selenouridine(34) synthase MnmH n=1 Tax=Algoriphagus mannitolivorans TaxID=226504 RepID=UPI00047E1311|nr:tRNA 2-selenouridine(34) synthase MnmH [Algoriphagus mannitolivorans]